MRLHGVPFAAIDWDRIPPEEHPGEKGTARSRTYLGKAIRLRMVEYSPGYAADH